MVLFPTVLRCALGKPTQEHTGVRRTRPQWAQPEAESGACIPEQPRKQSSGALSLDLCSAESSPPRGRPAGRRRTGASPADAPLGSGSCTWQRVVSFCLLFSPRQLACLLLPLVPASAARDSQLTCLRKQNTSPQGSDLSIQWFPVLRHTFGRCLKGSWAWISWAGTLTRSCPGSVRPRGRCKPLPPPSLPTFSLVPSFLDL